MGGSASVSLSEPRVIWAYAKHDDHPESCLELIVEAKKSDLDVDPTSGEDLQLLIKDLMNQTGTVIERVKNLLH
jgi:hypothetical protein